MLTVTPPAPRFFHSFSGGDVGQWGVQGVHQIKGDSLPVAQRVFVGPIEVSGSQNRASWTLRGATSNERYVTREEKVALTAKQEGLGRAAATRAALIPIRKSAAWWAMPQDERRNILEAQSHHIATGLKYLPKIARRLYHCRDIDGREPFDFLTWFEFAPADKSVFDELVDALRASYEWRFVDREVDIRLSVDYPSSMQCRHVYYF